MAEDIPRPPYSRFKAFLFLTVFAFGVIWAIAHFTNNKPKGQDTSALQKVAQKKENLATKESAPLIQGEIPEAWRDDVGVPVLCYHQIVSEEEYRKKPTPFAITAEEFTEQMEWLHENKFYTILPDELLAYTKGEKNLDFSNGKRPVVLTFDDGNNDFVNYAEAPMKKYGYKGVLFIYPTYIMAKPRKKRALTWDEIRRLGKEGHAVESHTMWHPNLSTMTDDEQRAQFRDSKKALDKHAGVNVKHLAYPFGVHTSKSAELLRETGYTSAYTTFNGGNQRGEDPYLLRRFLIVKSDQGKIFAQKTLARSLPYRFENFKGGDILEGMRDLRLKIPKNLDSSHLKVRIFSTAQKFEYVPQSGILTVHAIPSKKALSVLEVVYKESGIEYRASVLLNHKRDTLLAQHVSGKTEKNTQNSKKVKKKKRKKKRNLANND
ncbi:MAG: hypothetical protein LDLANPLL_01885 [Turneriella sp.]|nr:hypothetical protein [Turneriella sp.]